MATKKKARTQDTAKPAAGLDHAKLKRTWHVVLGERMHERDYTFEDAKRGHKTHPKKATRALAARTERANLLVEEVLKEIGKTWPNQFFDAHGRFKRWAACDRVVKAMERAVLLAWDEQTEVSPESALPAAAAAPLKELLKLHGKAQLTARTLWTHSVKLAGWTRADCEAEQRQAAGAGQPDDAAHRLYEQAAQKRRARVAAQIEEAKRKVAADDKAKAARKAKPRRT